MLVKWNDRVKLIISDVDETVADLYVPADRKITVELSSLLEEGKILFFVTGQGLKSVQWRIIDQIPKKLRSHILVGHCSGVEVWGYDNEGSLQSKPFYSLYENSLSEDQKNRWREIIKQLVKEFKLQIFPTMPVPKFIAKTKANPLAIMLEDRGPQITFEVVNGYDYQGNDLRIPILERAEKLLEENNLPITPRIAGVFALDFVVKGVNKTTAVKYVLENERVLRLLGITKEGISDPTKLEVWGDKFSAVRGGTDRYISEALPKEVRSISFREEDQKEFLEGYNIVVWDGQKHLQEGLLEYLKSRSSGKM